MYKSDDLLISGNKICVKKYTGSEIDGAKHYNWVTLITVNPQNIKGMCLSYFMQNLKISLTK